MLCGSEPPGNYPAGAATGDSEPPGNYQRCRSRSEANSSAFLRNNLNLSAAMLANLKSSAKAGPGAEEQVVTIESSSDSEEISNGNSMAENLATENQLPESSPQAQMSGQYDASESQSHFVQNYQHQQEDTGIYDETIPLHLNDLQNF